MPFQNILQQRPVLWIVLEYSGIEKEEQNPFFGGVDQVPGGLEVLLRGRFYEPRSDFAAVHLIRLRGGIALHTVRGVVVPSFMDTIPRGEIIRGDSGIVDDDSVVGLGAQPGVGPVRAPG